MRKKAIIIGADPIGLTAAYELLLRTDIFPIILERSGNAPRLSEKGKNSLKGLSWLRWIFRLLRKKEETVNHWENLARQIERLGGKILLHHQILSIYAIPKEICSLHAIDTCTGELFLYTGHYFISSMPVQEFVRTLETPASNKGRIYIHSFDNLFLKGSTRAMAKSIIPPISLKNHYFF